jgi:hypothetical protein
MRLLRAHLRYAACLALLALVVQFAVSFAHVHRDDLLPAWPGGGPSASRLNPALPDGSSAPSTDHDFCTICASIALAGSLILPQPPMVAVATVPRQSWLINRVIILASTDQRRHFQARGPPV